MTRTATPARWSLRTALPADRETTDTSYRDRSIRVSSENKCSWAPPFVPVARTSTTRIRRPAASFGRSTGVRQASHGTGALMSAVPASDEDPLNGLVDRAPVVLVRLVAAQEVEPWHAGGQGARDHGVDHQHARRQVVGGRVDARVVVEV